MRDRIRVRCSTLSGSCQFRGEIVPYHPMNSSLRNLPTGATEPGTNMVSQEPINGRCIAVWLAAIPPGTVQESGRIHA